MLRPWRRRLASWRLSASLNRRFLIRALLSLSLLISEDLCLSLDFPAIAVLSAHLSEGTKTLRSLRKERKTQKSSLISKQFNGGLGGENPAALPQARPIFEQPFSLPESAQTLAGIAFRAAGKSGNHFPAASKFAGKYCPTTSPSSPPGQRSSGL